MKKLSTMAILAVSAASAFAADYTVVKSGEWYQSGVFGDGVTAPVATSEETAIDNLSFASSGLSLKLTGHNAGHYFIKNLAGSASEAQTVEITTNSIWQTPRIANITGDENYRLTLNFGRKGITTDNPGNSFLYTYLSDDSSSSTFSNATVNIYSGFYANNLSLKNASLNVERYYANTTTASTFKSLTIDGKSSLSIDGGIYRGGNITTSAGSSIVIKNAKLNAGYIDLGGNMEFTGEKGSLVASGKIRICTKDAVLTLHGSELLSGNTSGTAKMSMNFYESGKVFLGGNESLGYIATTITKSGSKYLDTNKTVTFVLHEDTTLFSIDELYQALNSDYTSSLKGTGKNTDGTEFYWDIKYNFENFKNGVVRIGQTLTEDELANQIVADGWKDFTQNSDGYLFATQIPEPATMAFLLGGLAIAFALMRRRR